VRNNIFKIDLCNFYTLAIREEDWRAIGLGRSPHHSITIFDLLDRTEIELAGY
jgi:hypothetical protein